MTQNEALVKLEAERKAVSANFCPLIKGQCRRDCASFFPGRVYKECNISHFSTAKAETYEASSPCCTNALIIGAIQLEQ